MTISNEIDNNSAIKVAGRAAELNEIVRSIHSVAAPLLAFTPSVGVRTDEWHKLNAHATRVITSAVRDAVDRTASVSVVTNHEVFNPSVRVFFAPNDIYDGVSKLEFHNGPTADHSLNEDPRPAAAEKVLIDLFSLTFPLLSKWDLLYSDPNVVSEGDLARARNARAGLDEVMGALYGFTHANSDDDDPAVKRCASFLFETLVDYNTNRVHLDPFHLLHSTVRSLLRAIDTLM